MTTLYHMYRIDEMLIPVRSQQFLCFPHKSTSSSRAIRRAKFHFAVYNNIRYYGLEHLQSFGIDAYSDVIRSQRSTAPSVVISGDLCSERTCFDETPTIVLHSLVSG